MRPIHYSLLLSALLFVVMKSDFNIINEQFDVGSKSHLNQNKVHFFVLEIICKWSYFEEFGNNEDY
jgi:hypothetical protein